ncbi:hypothetical protein PENTCL1PPCAC_22713, partial [Pristionchus entomophagus]
SPPLSPQMSRLERSRSALRHRPSPLPTRRELTLVVLGDKEVGKTAIVSQFLWSQFVRDYRETIEEFNWIEYDLGENDRLLLQVIDSGGSRDFLAMRHLYIRTANAFLVVCSVDSEESVNEAKKIIEEIREKRSEVVVIVIFNKIDLFCDESEWKTRDMTSFCRSHSIPIVKMSAKDSQDVEDLFDKFFSTLWSLAPTPLNRDHLKKRRQSMPVLTPSSISIDSSHIQKIQRKHKARCSIQ